MNTQVLPALSSTSRTRKRWWQMAAVALLLLTVAYSCGRASVHPRVVERQVPIYVSPTPEVSPTPGPASSGLTPQKAGQKTREALERLRESGREFMQGFTQSPAPSGQ